MAAAEKASLREFVESLPRGYDTHLGENGMRFSGGERQRVALARAFLKNAPILILDEATSSLDRKTELEIQNSVTELLRGKTALVIAHRLSTIEQAGQICVIERGRVAAHGTYGTLLDGSDAFRTLMGAQFAAPVEG